MDSNSILKCLKHFNQLRDCWSCVIGDRLARKSPDTVTWAQWHGYSRADSIFLIWELSFISMLLIRQALQDRREHVICWQNPLQCYKVHSQKWFSLSKHTSQLSNLWPLFLLLWKGMEQIFSSDGWSSAGLELCIQEKGRNSSEQTVWANSAKMPPEAWYEMYWKPWHPELVRVGMCVLSQVISGS